MRLPSSEQGKDIELSLSDQQIEAARKIDQRVKQLRAVGADDAELLAEMHDLMPNFKILLDTAQPGQMDELCVRFEGFHYYAKLLERLAQGIASGSIKVP